jgi:hypothetical protein
MVGVGVGGVVQRACTGVSGVRERKEAMVAVAAASSEGIWPKANMVEAR